jgi:hypothetical protein
LNKRLALAVEGNNTAADTATVAASNLPVVKMFNFVMSKL